MRHLGLAMCRTRLSSSESEADKRIIPFKYVAIYAKLGFVHFAYTQDDSITHRQRLYAHWDGTSTSLSMSAKTIRAPTFNTRPDTISPGV